jgi:hypothetical protein
LTGPAATVTIDLQHSLIIMLEDDLSIISLVENPFRYRKTNDILSLLFHRYHKHTDIPLALPIFYFMCFLSVRLMKNKSLFEVPGTKQLEELNLWLILLANSGSSKTFCLKSLQSLLPEGGKELNPVIKNAVGPKALIQELRGNTRCLWIEDEGVQKLKEIENMGSPIHEFKPMLLQLNSTKKIDRITAKEKIEIIDGVYTLMFLGTPEVFDDMLKRSKNMSLHDGLLRRFQCVFATSLDNRTMEDRALYKFDDAQDEVIEKEIEQIWSKPLYPKYTFSEDCITVYETAFKNVWLRHSTEYKNFSLPEGMYRTSMMECFKYAVLHHIMKKRAGSIVNSTSLQFGLKVSLFLLRSFIKAMDKNADNINFGKHLTTTDTNTQHKKEIKIISFIENMEVQNLRIISRKFGLTKLALFSILNNHHDKERIQRLTIYRELLNWRDKL